jgi:hypothetical protein
MLTLQTASLDWALRHALRAGDTDVFPLPFEYQAIEHDWEAIREHLRQANVLSWTVRPHRILLFPKGRLGFRPITQLDPLDFLLYAATIYEMGEWIERRRVPVADEVVFSYRFGPSHDGRLFDPDVGYTQFLASSETAAASADYSHVVITDIADFYPRLYHHPLENALIASEVPAGHVTAVMHLLSGWNNTESYGIPVGGAPSRLLAEIALADIDDALRDHGVVFRRFNDDYRIFADSEAQAYRHLALLADILFSTSRLLK